ncbi:hypothetical protein ATJ97_1593 [Georgenia soli]|uniref:Glucosamine inositolphosphorylceramide transferase 1 N-terminal domain-containing protein n=1 Tax=Georgenia soli TaxID=638953 RepID=A0A2A9EJL5_9MICO|nr:hypothetical protein [Georgenia soli]PFG39098.1 hypothetical protein ATJ97_1593 [Georgenia soli]
MADRRVRVGLVSATSHATAYTKGLVDWAAHQDDVEITHLVLVRSPTGRLSGSAAGARVPMALRTLTALEGVVLRRFCAFRGHGRATDLGEVLETVPVPAEVAADGAVVFDEAAASLVAALGLDVLVVVDDGARLRGPLLDTARFGTLAVRPEAERLGPPGFWEVLDGRAATEYAIRRLRADGGSVVIRRGRAWTGLFAELNRAIVTQRSYHHLQLLLKELARAGAPVVTASRSRSSRPVPVDPWPAPEPATTADSLRYAARVAGTVTPKLVDKALGRPRWNVAWVHAPWREVGTARATALPRRRGHFHADPFVVARDGRHYLFTEDFERRAGRGRIFVHEICEGRSREVGVALTEPFHLSFPYLFEHGGELYLVPESARSRSIRIYRCTSFPLGWELARVAMHDVDAVDTMIFPFGGRWWLLTSIAPPGTGDYSAELFAFHADSPLADTWHPHAGNPLARDPGRARNGGIVLDGDEVYRVNQRHGFGTYGEEAVVNRVVELTPTTFVEEPVMTVSPNASLRVQRTHQLHTDGEYTVIDFVRPPGLRRAAVRRPATGARLGSLVSVADLTA